jgi:hypothetical protein
MTLKNYTTKSLESLEMEWKNLKLKTADNPAGGSLADLCLALANV